MSAPRVTAEDAKRFCDLCDWAHEAWMTHKCLFDDNPNRAEQVDRVPWFFNRLSIITQEYALQQIAKLHDPWRQHGQVNLSVDYIAECGAWGSAQASIDELRERLNRLPERLKLARNRVLSHNDRETAVANPTLGLFEAGEDNQYFDALQDLVNAVHRKWCGGPFPFNDLVVADSREFLGILERSARRH